MVEIKNSKKPPKLNYTSRFGNLSGQIREGHGAVTTTVSDLANPESAGMQVQFYHIATDRYAEFPAFITSFNDSFTSNWDPTETIGRMDPIMNFRNTTRSMSLGFEVPAISRAEAKSNLVEVNRLIQFLYPTYTKNAEARTMNGSPLVKVQFKNLIASAKNTKLAGTPLANLDLDAKSEGLICAITSLSATPDFEVGSFGQDIAKAIDPLSLTLSAFGATKVISDEGQKPDGVGMNFPKLWRVELSMNVLHDHSLDSNFENAAGFPYGLGDRNEVNKKLTTPTPKYFDFTSDKPDEDKSKAGTPGSGPEESSKDVKEAAAQQVLNPSSNMA